MTSKNAAAGPAPSLDNRIDVIDAFRGIAILSVLFYHFTVALAPPYEPTNFYNFSGQYPTWLGFGRYGVHLFFFISGIVISMTLVRSAGPVSFLWKRFARIYPAFFAAATATYLAGVVTGYYMDGSHPADYLATLLLVAPHLHRTWVDPVYWSLLVEAKFYLVVAASFFLLKTRFWAGVIGYALLVAVVASRHAWAAHDYLISDEMVFFLLGIGVWLLRFGRQAKAGIACMATGIALYAYYNFLLPGPCNPLSKVCMEFDPSWIAHLYILLTVGGLATLILTRRTASFEPLAWVGRISYSVYLTHDLLGLDVVRLVKRLGGPDALATIAAVVASLLVGAVMFHLLEEPAHRMLRTPPWLRRRPAAYAPAVQAP